MPVSALPDLDHVYAKWEKKGPGQMTKATNGVRNGRDIRSAESVVTNGKRKWREKYGSNIQPIRQRRTRERSKVVAIPAETITSNTIAQFKTMPTVLPEHFIVSRPFMGVCCSCLPNSQKDLITPTTSSSGMRNILDVAHEMRNSGVLSRKFCRFAYSWRTKTQHRYPELSMAVLTSQRVIDAVHHELLEEHGKHDQAKLEKQAKKIFTVMKNQVSNALTKFTGWFLHHFLGLLLSGVHVHKGQIKMVETACQRGLPVLFVPLHRSHLDYILVTWILWNYEIRSPHIAAGDNLNIPFFSFLIKGLGGFFIKRKLDKTGAKKDVLYRAVLQSYMEKMLQHGENMEFFIEGGRSRTGKACPPKGGLMSVVVDTLNKGLIEDVYVVPASISYEKILEGNFNDEQMGHPKRNETFLVAVRGIWNVLKGHYGSARVNFAQPFSLKEYLHSSQQIPSPRGSDTSLEISPSTSPPGFPRRDSSLSLYGTDIVNEDQRQLIHRLGEHIIHTCVHSSPVMSTNLLAFLLLTKHRQGSSLKQIVADYQWLREEILVRKRDVGFSPSSSIEEVVHYSCSLLGKHLIKREKGESKDEDMFLSPVIVLPHVFELSYYGNQVMSVFALESLLVNTVIYLSEISLSSLERFREGEVILMSREEILEVAAQLCHLLKYDFLFIPPCGRLEDTLADTLDKLVTSEILKIEEQQFDAYHNTYDKQWAKRLSNSLSWNEDADGEEDFYAEEQLLRVNIERDDIKEKLKFLHSVLAPFFEAYYVTAYHIGEITDTEMPEADFIKKLHTHAKSRVTDGVASYGESAAQETIKNAIKSFTDLKILDCYCAGNLRMVELNSRYNVKDRLNEYLTMLSALRP